MTVVDQFIQTTPTAENRLRGIVLFGRNVASYKFALGKALVDLAAQGKEAVSLEELAVPFSAHLCEHLKDAPKQATSASSKFLDACRQFNEGQITEDALRSKTAEIGFVNVIDAFHRVGTEDIPQRFFVDERKTATKGIRLTEEIQKVAAADPAQALAEIEARWRLVETAWATDVSVGLITYETETGLLIPSSRRKPLTSARNALNGYQKGRCFYCYRPIGTTPEATDLADVDHLFPFVLQERGLTPNLDQVWNLVLACKECNGPGGKWYSAPGRQYVERLHKRNEYLIASHHPLRETLINQTGATRDNRRTCLQKSLDLATANLLTIWTTPALADPIF